MAWKKATEQQDISIDTAKPQKIQAQFSTLIGLPKESIPLKKDETIDINRLSKIFHTEISPRMKKLSFSEQEELRTLENRFINTAHEFSQKPEDTDATRKFNMARLELQAFALSHAINKKDETIRTLGYVAQTTENPELKQRSVEIARKLNEGETLTAEEKKYMEDILLLVGGYKKAREKEGEAGAEKYFEEVFVKGDFEYGHRWMRENLTKSEFDSIIQSVTATIEAAKTAVDEIQRAEASMSAVDNLRKAAEAAVEAILGGDDEKAAALLESAGSSESKKEARGMKAGLIEGGGSKETIEKVIKKEAEKLEKSISRAAKPKTSPGP